MIRNTLFVTQTTLFVNQMTQDTLFYDIYGDGHTSLENMILGQFKMGENQAKCRTLQSGKPFPFGGHFIMKWPFALSE